MPLSVGTRLGPYEIVAPIGAGGMGEVYQARDTRLDRQVAVKILPSEFAQNTQFKIRFEREAKTISQLNHPHICTLYDVGHENGSDYLVMELLEGETLADRIARGHLPLNEVLKLGMQIAEALDKAHRAGVIHRDLKPGNVMITKSGAKLLDFGLARSSAQPVAASDATQHKPLTQEGTIVGTYQYMAPEQLAGDEADARSDIFSFGAVLYEMLTGARAFEGKTKTSLISAIVGGEPRPASQLQPLTPPALEHVITKALAKERDDRWQSAADMASELDWISRSSSYGGLPAVVAKTRLRRRRLIDAAFAITILIAVAAIAAATYFARRLATVEQPMRAELLLPADVTLRPVVFGAVALSPDARRVALAVGPSTKPQLAVHDLQNDETKTLAGTEGATYPFWSPDSQQIGFFAQGKLKTISANGGGVQILCDAPQGRGGSWSALGVIIFTPNITQPIFKVSEGGGTPIAVTKPKQGWTNRNPVFLPDGSRFLYVARDNATMSAGALYAGSIDGNVEKRILENASNAVFVDGRILFLRNENLVMQHLDPKELTVSGTPIPLAQHVEYYSPRDLGNFSATGQTLLYVPAVSVPRQVVAFDQTGRQIGAIGQAGDYNILDVSPDGRRAAISVGNSSNADVWIMQLDRGMLSRATFSEAPFGSAVFSSDGSRLAYSDGGALSGRRTRVTIHSLDSGATEEVLESSTPIQIWSWSADGQYLIVTTQEDATGFDIGHLPIRERKIIPLLDSRFDERAPALSPNGKWLAYISDESGAQQVYVTLFPSCRRKWQISSDTGALPRWSRDGRKLFFLSRGKLNVVDMREGSSPEFGAPVVLPIPFDFLTLNVPGYGLAPDGRILMTRALGDAPPKSIHLVANWTKLLPTNRRSGSGPALN